MDSPFPDPTLFRALPTLPMPRGVRTASMMNASALCESPGLVLRISCVDDGTALRCVDTDRTALLIRHVGVPAHRTERPFQTSAHAGDRKSTRLQSSH